VHATPIFLIEVIALHQSCHFASMLSLHPVKEEVFGNEVITFLLVTNQKPNTGACNSELSDLSNCSLSKLSHHPEKEV
jgi:hypothetical protein